MRQFNLFFQFYSLDCGSALIGSLSFVLNRDKLPAVRTILYVFETSGLIWFKSILCIFGRPSPFRFIVQNLWKNRINSVLSPLSPLPPPPPPEKKKEERRKGPLFARHDRQSARNMWAMVAWRSLPSCPHAASRECWLAQWAKVRCSGLSAEAHQYEEKSRTEFLVSEW